MRFWGAKTFFRLKKGGEEFFFRQIFPKTTRHWYLVNFDPSLTFNINQSLYNFNGIDDVNDGHGEVSTGDLNVVTSMEEKTSLLQHSLKFKIPFIISGVKK